MTCNSGIAWPVARPAKGDNGERPAGQWNVLRDGEGGSDVKLCRPWQDRRGASAGGASDIGGERVGEGGVRRSRRDFRLPAAGGMPSEATTCWAEAWMVVDGMGDDGVLSAFWRLRSRGPASSQCPAWRRRVADTRGCDFLPLLGPTLCTCPMTTIQYIEDRSRGEKTCGCHPPCRRCRADPVGGTLRPSVGSREDDLGRSICRVERRGVRLFQPQEPVLMAKTEPTAPA